MPSKLVIGIDPGSIVCGYGILRSQNNSISYIASGQIKPYKKEPLCIRLKYIYKELSDIIAKYKPDEAVIEKVFYAKGIKAALNLGHARGAAMLCASINELPVIEYSPLEIKQAVTGYGRADKNQVLEMVKVILNLNTPLSTDTSDALAAAICHINRAEFILENRHC
ncbi:Holliday junction resolvase [Candidatus Magnetoovum chiemensis]|nr:Holliday junction resolvase [Candidatus Magnetoovum chiemensis]